MRRLTRYSIRSLLVLVTLACVVLGWYVVNRDARQREVEATMALSELMGGSIATTQEESTHDIMLPTDCKGIANARLTRPRWLTRWLNSRKGPFCRVVRINLWESLDDRAIPQLAQLKSLEEIHFSHSRLSQEGKTQLRALFPDATIEFETQPEPDPDDPFG